MRCPFCKKNDDKVTNSRYRKQNNWIYRMRECNNCKKRYDTREVIIKEWEN